jgi:hypothetical protein
MRMVHRSNDVGKGFIALLLGHGRDDGSLGSIIAQFGRWNSRKCGGDVAIQYNIQRLRGFCGM